MKIRSIRLRGVRCFADTNVVALSPACNIFVGLNNSGKSTLLKSITDFQIRPTMEGSDARPRSPISITEMVLSEIDDQVEITHRPGGLGAEFSRYCLLLQGPYPSYSDGIATQVFQLGQSSLFPNNWPRNAIVPFSAKRKASNFSEDVSMRAHNEVTGTFANLYGRIDRVATPGMSAHELYRNSIESIVGSLITTRSSPNGKQAGFYFDDDNFITLDRMGDGVSEVVALIVELSLAKGKIFVLEEPETNLHPSGLKGLLTMVRKSMADNQFIVATHSNIVVRELSGDSTKIFRVSRDGDLPGSPSEVNEVENTSSAHRILLRELGYDFGDFDLHDGWLFLEEASAETIVRELLIPWFSQPLQGRLRTFSAGGVTNLDSSVFEFQRLVSFIHLQPVYQDRLWVRAGETSRALR